ncbi:MAG: type II toxin-antitoxin system YhaV family toxin [Rubrivivax sp.]|nr:type II toxin-antitoxin system YhaV family toxin [Rubrivivax sp.]
MSGRKGEAQPLVVNGWTFFAHPIFLDQLSALTEQVEALKHKVPDGYTQKDAAQRLVAIAKLTFDVIPQDPAHQSTDDADRVFRRMLESGRPPSDGGQRLAEARAESGRLGRLASGR